VILCLCGRADIGFLVSVAIKCSSWVSVNRGTARREDWFPEGNWLLPSVREANKMIARLLPQTLPYLAYCFYGRVMSVWGDCINA